MSKIAVLVALGCALVVTPASADAGKTTGKNNPNKVVCRSDNSTGTRLTQTKQCMTLAQWAELKQANRIEVDKIQSNRYKNN